MLYRIRKLNKEEIVDSKKYLKVTNCKNSYHFYYDPYFAEVFKAKYWKVEKKNVIAMSKKVEELCDKFIIFDKCSDSPHIRTSLKEVKAYKTIYDKVDKKFIKVIYGAIWTSKGLIYVAKTNEKGEFEVL